MLACACGDRTIRIWDSATGKRLFQINGHEHVVSAVSFSPDGKRLASGSWDNTGFVWDLERLKSVQGQ